MDPISEYIAKFPPTTKKYLEKIRGIVRKMAPDALEGMNYGMPGYKLQGKPLVYFAGYEKHIGLYATPSGHKEFAKELSKYKQGKGSVQFPLDQSIPFDLIQKIVEFRVAENNNKAELKRQKKTCANGHVFYKSSDCPTSPECEKLKKPPVDFMTTLSAPARRALESNGITTLKKLAKLSKDDILKFHGIGKASIPKLEAELKKAGMKFHK